jgi:hypothetical protein
VPKKDEKPIMGLVSDKNFIVANAVENILAGKYSHQQLEVSMVLLQLYYSWLEQLPFLNNKLNS